MSYEDIKIVKLISGEEIIGSVTTPVGEGLIKVKHPILLGLTHEGVAMMPFMPMADHEDSTVEFKKDHVMLIARPEKELANQFNSKFGSGIVLPGAQRGPTLHLGD